MKKEEFDTILKENNLTRKDFANLSGIQYTTVGKWNNENRPIPVWVKSWIENYIEKKRFDDIKQTLKDSGMCDE